MNKTIKMIIALVALALITGLGSVYANDNFQKVASIEYKACDTYIVLDDSTAAPVNHFDDYGQAAIFVNQTQTEAYMILVSDGLQSKIAIQSCKFQEDGSMMVLVRDPDGVMWLLLFHPADRA